MNERLMIGRAKQMVDLNKAKSVRHWGIAVVTSEHTADNYNITLSKDALEELCEYLVIAIYDNGTDIKDRGLLDNLKKSFA